MPSPTWRLKAWLRETGNPAGCLIFLWCFFCIYTDTLLVVTCTHIIYIYIYIYIFMYVCTSDSWWWKEAYGDRALKSQVPDIILVVFLSHAVNCPLVERNETHHIRSRSRSRSFILGTNKSTKKDRRAARTPNWSQTGNGRSHAPPWSPASAGEGRR